MSDHGDIAGLQGTITPDRPLAPLSWLRVGGAAEVFFAPRDVDDLARFLTQWPEQVPIMPIGVCSNLIIRDGGLAGAVVRLGRAFNGISFEAGSRVRAGAAALDAHVARRAADAGIAGLEFLRTIPGSIGGAVKMNAGCYGHYVADVLVEATVMGRDGRVTVWDRAALGFSYRHSALPDDSFVLEVVLQGEPGDPVAINASMEQALARRAETQPVDARSCGSTFRNPAGFSSTGRSDDIHDLKAWKLIEDAGCRGMRHGGAQISPKHANFLINTGDATAADLEELGEIVRERVLNLSGISLEWEVLRVGIR